MNWINRAEQRFGHLALHGVAWYLVVLNCLVFVLYKLDPRYIDFISFSPEEILQGQVWRLVTFIFIPAWQSLIPLPDWFAVVLYFLWMYFVTSGLEEAIGAFRLNVYYLIGIVACAAACFLFSGYPAVYVGVLLNISVFLGFARFYPDHVVQIMFVLPVKIKWLAWLSAFWVVYQFILGGWALRAAIGAGMMNYFIFFGRDLWEAAVHRRQVAARRATFERKIRENTEETLHRCAVCQRTEASSGELEFRVAADGEEYCTEHLPRPAA